MPVVVGTRVESGMWKIYRGSVFDELGGSGPTEVDLGLVRLKKEPVGVTGAGVPTSFTLIWRSMAEPEHEGIAYSGDRIVQVVRVVEPD